MHLSETPQYKAWHNMKRRCDNPNHAQYQWYGARGISYDPSWSTYEGFVADMGERPEGKELDRIDNDGNYCKDNCRWVSRSEQMRNTRKTIAVTMRGKTQCLKDWCVELGLVYNTVVQRIRLGGKTPEEALSYPTGKKGGVPSTY